MMTAPRRTAVLRLGDIGGGSGLRALDVQRLYPFELTIDGRAMAAGQFASPLGDQAWRTFAAALSDAASMPTESLADRRRAFETIRSVGRQMFVALTQLHESLREYLAGSDPRRLVISSGQPELHALPWEALVDERWSHPACSDLSIVHSLDLFEPLAYPVRSPVTVAKIMGPDTARGTEAPLDALLERAARSRSRDPRVVLADTATGSLVHIEAHGDPNTGTIQLEHDDFLDQLRSKSLVLLWSCVSNLIQPWGESLAMKLHRQDNRFVLGFTTPLREDTAAALAGRFYQDVFNGNSAIDPESQITRMRCRLYSEERLRACEWAAVSLWLRSAVDLSAAVLDGPRLPEDAWSTSSDAAGDRVEPLRKEISRHAHGHPLVIGGIQLNTVASASIAADYRGPAVHIRHSKWNEDLAHSLTQLGVSAPSRHPADRLMALIDNLGTFREPFLLWTGVDQRTVSAMQWLIPVPASLLMVLVSPSLVDVPPGIVRAHEDRPESKPIQAVAQSDLLVTLEDYEASGEYGAVAKAWDAACRQAAAWDPERLRRLHAVGYWSFIRLDRRGEAENCLKVLDRVAPVEAALLRGNLASRLRQPDEAERFYHAAETLAAGSLRDEGRALVELAHIAASRADTGAEVLYRDALSRLERAGDADDERWRSALGRVLRDYADLLARDETRLAEADGYLRRALMIHALDGRRSQLVASLQTRGTLERTRRSFAAADKAIGAAVSLQYQFGNTVGWAQAIHELIEVALEGGAPQRALSLAGATLAKLSPDDRDRGRIAALAARACWQMGDLRAAGEWAQLGLKWLPPTAAESVSLSIMCDVVESLIASDPPRG